MVYDSENALFYANCEKKKDFNEISGIHWSSLIRKFEITKIVNRKRISTKSVLILVNRDLWAGNRQDSEKKKYSDEIKGWG